VTEAAARGLGLAGLLEARRLTSGVDLTALGLGMERLLEATRADYLGRLGASLERRLGTAAAERCDVPFWRRTDDVDPFFEAEGLVPAVAATLRALGIDPDRQPGLEIDLERRRGKSSRAFCAPVRIPHEIKIVLLPRGGQDDYAALLHEMGHAQHFVWTSPDTPAEHRVVGDRALGEGYAALLERLAATEAWVRPRLGERTAAFLGSRALDRAHAVRREAARFLFDLRSISAAPPGDPDRDYAELLGEATGFGYHGTSHLEDADGELSGQAYLRGWMLESALGEYLRERFGTSWFASRQAGDLLKEIWNSGQLYTADELARELGLGGLDPDRLAEDLRAGLRR
jgi:hypothetical protein